MNDLIIVGGGQSGLAAARAARAHGLEPIVLEAGPEPVGSWPHYYDSLTLFSPAVYSAMAGIGFPGDPEHYPHRLEVVEYLRRYAAGLGVDIRTHTTVTAVEHDPAQGFEVRTADGATLQARALVAASGAFANPYRPVLPGQDDFTGQLLHVAEYHNPDQYAGERVVVVGGGNSAVQVGYELAKVAEVTLATRHPITFFAQRPHGRDVHHWLTTTGFDQLPPEWLARIVGTRLVMDTGDYRTALDAGLLDRRPMFDRLHGDQVVWADGDSEHVDTVILATGYLPHLPYLGPIGATDAGSPQHSGGISTTHLGLAYVGLEFQRSFASNTLRGVHRDAEHVMAPLAAYVRRAPATLGLGGPPYRVGRR